MTPSPSQAIAANRAAWDDSAPLHRNNTMWRRIAEGFATPGFHCFDGEHALMGEALANVGLADKDVAQVCCNNGRETISLRNLGARRAVGFDQSAAFLAQARELNAIAGQDCLFVECDANSIPAEHHGQFDLVVITIGVFGWMPDIDRFMRSATSLLRTKGQLLIYEEHPVANMFEVASARPMEAVNSYFKATPFVEKRAIIYDDAPTPDVSTHYWFVHPLSAVMTAIVASGLNIEIFREYGRNISSTAFNVLEQPEPILPLSYLLRAGRG
ncbi:MAG: class I SAM-dependent methyltransferase [Beijerinckiaceae bacterium]